MTNPTGVTTSQAGMTAAAQEFAARYQEFSVQKATVQSEVELLMSSWHGQAANKYNEAMMVWQQQFDRVLQNLETMLTAMGVNKNTYINTEDTNVGGVQNFAAGLPNF